MKKKTLFLLIPVCGVFLTGCDAVGTLRSIKDKVKEPVKKVMKKIDELIPTGESTTESGEKISYRY